MCAAQLRIIRQGSTQVIVVLNVLVDEAGHPHLTVTTPTGVSIAKGVEMVVAGGLAHKLAFDTCDANQCTASTPLDDKLAKDLQTGASADVTITAINGAAVKVGFAVKGFDKALPAMGIKM